MSRVPRTTKRDIEPGVPAVVETPEPQGIPYALIGDEGKAKILGERIARLEAEHYSHSLNLKLAESMGDDATVANSKRAMVAIEQALQIVSSEIG